jgi:hypothetical protein
MMTACQQYIAGEFLHALTTRCRNHSEPITDHVAARGLLAELTHRVMPISPPARFSLSSRHAAGFTFPLSRFRVLGHVVKTNQRLGDGSESFRSGNNRS